MEKKQFIDKVLEIVSLIKYNGEKRDFIERALKRFMINPKEDFSIEQEIKLIFENKLPSDTKERTIENVFKKEELFEMQDYLLTIDVAPEDLLFYLSEKYSSYDQKLKNEMGVTITDIIKFSILLNKVYYRDLISGEYKFSENTFSSREEAYYPYNLQYPDEDSKKISEIASFITKESFIFILEKTLGKDQMDSIIKNIDTLFDLISFDQMDIIKDNKIRFQEKPLFKIDKDCYILLNDVHLLFGLIYRLDSLLNKYEWYTSNKGRHFENMVFKVLDEINKNKRIEGNFSSSIRYGEKNIYELDGLINFEDISWFVECKGRIPRSNSFKGKTSSVQEDLKKGITDAEYQALRAIQYSEKESKIGENDVKSRKGILIIVEGMYPNLNENPITQFEKKDSNYPRYIINFLTFMEILRQHDIYYLKKFLEWRSDPEMPLYCISELDYWDYFTQMQSGLDKKECYDLAKKNKNKVIYNGKRFNAPKYIKNED